MGKEVSYPYRGEPLDLTTYENRMIPIITDALQRIRGLRDSNYWGATARVVLAADEFLSAMGLEATKERVAQRSSLWISWP